MNRYTIKHSDMPLHIRLLPPLPKFSPLHRFDLEEGWFHLALVRLENLAQAPTIVWIAMVAWLDFVLFQWIGFGAIVLALAQIGDGLLLMQLAPRRISHGPLQPQWAGLAGLRMIVALACHVVPLVTVAPIPIGAALLFLEVNWLAIAAQAIGVALVVRGFLIEPAALSLSRIALSVPSFKRGSGVKLLHVADVHLERHGVREDKLLEIARAVRPDAILFTGDFLNLSYVYDPLAQKQAHALWQKMCAIAPVYAVAGSAPVDPPDVVNKIVNGFRWGGDPLTATKTGVVWLRDEMECLSVRDNHLHIVGTTCTHNPYTDGDALRKVMHDDRVTTDHRPPTAEMSLSAVGGLPSDASPFTILLHHSPDLAPQASALGTIDLQLAGHTHGGQVRLPSCGALITASLYHKALEMGLYQLNAMLLFVSRGVGLEGKGAPRVRFNCLPEVTLLELRGE